MGQRQRLTGELIESRVVGIMIPVGAEPSADQMLELLVDLVQPVQDDFDGLEQVLFDAGKLGDWLGHDRTCRPRSIYLPHEGFGTARMRAGPSLVRVDGAGPVWRERRLPD